MSPPTTTGKARASSETHGGAMYTCHAGTKTKGAGQHQSVLCLTALDFTDAVSANHPPGESYSFRCFRPAPLLSKTVMNFTKPFNC
jgi:hypothetical protein